MFFLSHLIKIQNKSVSYCSGLEYRQDFFGLKSLYCRLWTTGLFRGGAGAQPAGLRLQSERRERVQHGPVHPAPGRGRACSQRRPDTCEIFCSSVSVLSLNILQGTCLWMSCMNKRDRKIFSVQLLFLFLTPATRLGYILSRWNKS